jgi:hypothetical protein
VNPDQIPARQRTTNQTIGNPDISPPKIMNKSHMRFPPSKLFPVSLNKITNQAIE